MGCPRPVCDEAVEIEGKYTRLPPESHGILGRCSPSSTIAIIDAAGDVIEQIAHTFGIWRFNLDGYKEH